MEILPKVEEIRTYKTVFTKFASGSTARNNIATHQRKNFLVGSIISSAMQSFRLLHHLLPDHEESVDGDANVQRFGKDHSPVKGWQGKHHSPRLLELLSATSEDGEAQ